MKKLLFPMNLQFFADGGDGGTGGNEPQPNNPMPEIDYDKLANMVAGKQTEAEDRVLGGYFKQQGLSKEEADQAIAAFKQKKAESQPDVAKMQSDMQAAQNIALHSQMETKAMLMHEELGIDLKAISYVMKLADLSNVAKNGTINDEALKEALNKVLEDLPQLKKQAVQTPQGFRQVGAAPGTQQTPNQPDTPKAPTKRWNRFNY